MELIRRYIFNGSAVAYGGRLVRPSDVVLATDGGSPLSAAGGRAVWSTRDQKFGNTVKIGSAATFAEGLFDDFDKAVAVTYGRIAEDTLMATTSVAAEVKDVTVGDATADPPEPQLRIKRLRASLNSKSPNASYEAAVRLGDDTLIEGVSVDRYRLEIDLEKTLFQKLDTRAKLLTAADDPKFVKANGRLLFMTTQVGNKQVPVGGRLIKESGIILGTIVRNLRWDGKPYPGSEIDGNMVRIPNFGRIYFGELYIRASSRRLVMVRLQLGSPTGGSMVMGDVDANGSWSF